MRGTTSLGSGLTLACILLLGCGEERERPPPAAVSSGGGPSIGGGEDDSGAAASDEDAGGMPDAALDGGDIEDVVKPGECRRVDPTLIGSDAVISQVTLPTDLTVTRMESTWEGGCRNPTIRITLSDGNCPNGNGHEFVLFLEAEALGSPTSLITGGQNTIRPEPGDVGLRVRYRRPEPLEPAGEWGTCMSAGAGASAEGFVNFVEIPTSFRNENIVADFQIDLAPCDEETVGTQTLIGKINANLQRGLTDVCPATP